MSDPYDGDEYEDADEFEKERLRRWRLVLGSDAEACGGKDGLTGEYARIDAVLRGIYDARGQDGQDGRRSRGSLDASAPYIAKLLGDARKYFPQSTALVIQKDAFEKFGIGALLEEPELLEELEVDVNLAATLVSFSGTIPDKTKSVARAIIKKLVDKIMRKIRAKTISAIRGAINRSESVRRPRPGELNPGKTIMRNIKNWNPKLRKLIVEQLYGFGHKRKSLYDVVLCVDESGSMARSVVYSSVFAATLAQLPSLSTKLVFFDTSVVDMTPYASDPVEVLFGAQLGGGTDIAQALTYCSSLITRPNKTILILISDLMEGGDERVLYSQMERFVQEGVKPICLLALDDEGVPSYDKDVAGRVAALNVPTFGCTPDLFPEMFAAAIEGRDLSSWATDAGMKTVHPDPDAKFDLDEPSNPFDDKEDNEDDRDDENNDFNVDIGERYSSSTDDDPIPF